MRFSIGNLLAAMFLVALGLLVWRTTEETQVARARLAQLRREIDIQKAELRVDDPELHRAFLNVSDELVSLTELQDRAIEGVAALQAKYGVISLQGDDVVSVRSVPSLPAADGATPISFGLLVPAERPVWLKFGVYQIEGRSYPTLDPATERQYMSKSAFDPSGPFEVHLEPGSHQLSVAIGTARNGSLPIEIKLNERILLSTTCVENGLTGSSWTYISGDTQNDFNAGGRLPGLLTLQMSTHVSRSDQGHPKVLFSLWLDDRHSGFHPFPP